MDDFDHGLYVHISLLSHSESTFWEAMRLFREQCRFESHTDPSLADREQGLSSDRKSIQRVVMQVVVQTYSSWDQR